MNGENEGEERKRKEIMRNKERGEEIRGGDYE